MACHPCIFHCADGRRYDGSANDFSQYVGIDPGTTPCDTPAEQPEYDLDGNLIDDCVFTYTWDMENRLAAITPTSRVEDGCRRRLP